MRLRGYDYSQPGGYFVTICAQHRKCMFGTIIDGKIQLNEVGKIIVESWNYIPQHFPSVELDEYVIMPNHLHGIIVLGTAERDIPYSLVGAGFPRPTVQIEQPTPSTVEARSPRPSENATNRRGEVTSPSLGKIVAYFKYQSTKHINQHYNMPGTRIWQRNYYDHVIRNDPDLQRLRQYIHNNPIKWILDQLHPDNPSKW